MVRRFKGIFINVGSPPAKIQDVSDFGKWVKIKLEYKRDFVEDAVKLPFDGEVDEICNVAPVRLNLLLGK